MKGFDIMDQVLSMIICSGCFDLYHLCQGQKLKATNLVCKASEFLQIPLLVFMIENGSEINTKNDENSAPLHYAGQNGHINVVEYLVNQKAEI